MARRYNDNIVRMEKRVTNKFGLFLVFIIVVAGLGYGGYYLYQHRKEFDWNFELPWKKNNNEEDENNENSNNPQKKPTKYGDLNIPTLNKKEVKDRSTIFTLKEVRADDKGYIIDVEFLSTSGESNLKVEKVLIDGFDTSATLDVSNNVETGSATKAEIRIPKTETDALNITGFSKIIIFYRITQNTIGKLSRVEVKVYNKLDFDNSRKGLVDIYDNKSNTGFSNVRASFYKTEVDKDYTYIYFDFKNYSADRIKNIKVKKLLINGKLYEYKDLNEELYCEAEKVFYIAIPKKEVRDVKEFTVSFLITDKSVDKETVSFSITSDYTKTI